MDFAKGAIMRGLINSDNGQGAQSSHLFRFNRSFAPLVIKAELFNSPGRLLTFEPPDPSC
jgi:hypothetical protein